MIVCGVVQSWNPVDDPEKKHIEVENVIPVAGNFDSSTGKSLDPKVTRLKAQDVNANGLQIELNGGYYNKNKQRAVIQLQCDPDRTGNEARRMKRDDKEEDGDDEEPSTSSLSFVSYGPVEGKEKLEVVRFNWKTKYACEDYADSDEAKKAGWGFFTWFILMYGSIRLLRDHKSILDSHLTDFPCKQYIPQCRCLPHLRLLAELQPLRCSRMGPFAARRYHSRYSISIQGLFKKSRRHGFRRWVKRWL